MSTVPSYMRWLWVVPLLLVLVHAAMDVVLPEQLIREVDRFGIVPFFESKWTYAYLHMFSFLPVFLLSFDKKVHYYRKWKYMLPGMFVIAAFFILWDVWFTWMEVWGFNERYYLDLLIWHLPLEEWLFFITIPFCCIFIYECVDAYLPTAFWQTHQKRITLLLIAFLLFGMLVRWGHIYTVTTFGLTASLLGYHFINGQNSIGGKFYLSYVISCIPFFLVNGVLTGSLTEQPVVMYNPDEYFGLRLGTVPLDDMVYSMLLLFSNILCYEYVRSIWKKRHVKTGNKAKKILYYESLKSHHEHMSTEAK